MRPEIIYIHGAEAQDSVFIQNSLFNRIVDELGGFRIHQPKMPNPFNPDCQQWMDVIDAAIHKLNGPITLIGHSLGASVILKYLSERWVEPEIGSTHLLATPFWSSGMQFAISPINFEKMEMYSCYFYQCEDDQIVPPSHLNRYRKLLPDSMTHIQKSGGHDFTHSIEPVIENIKTPKTQSILSK